MKALIVLIILALPLNLWSKTVLYIGDSHSVGPFGWNLDESLRADGNEVYTVASCGSIPKWWYTGQPTPCGFFQRDLSGKKTQTEKAKTPLITDLINELKPEVVILEFGGNYLLLPSDQFIIDDIRKILKTVRDSGAECFWITNPDTRANRGAIPRVAKLMKEAIGDTCPMFESYLVTKYPTTGGDGTHYWFPAAMELAKQWAADAFAAYKEKY